MFDDVRCVVCDSHGKWESVDQLRLKPAMMAICDCGFVTYPERIHDKHLLKDYYDHEYRAAPNSNNLYTGQAKLNYHGSFLASLFNKWKKEKKETPVVFEIGSALGMYLDWVRKFFPKADLGGTEWTGSYRRVAYHEYGLKLQMDFDESKQYDLISSYKVAEHQIDIDKEILRYKKCLKPDGFLYISVPTWFHKMTNFGKGGFDMEYYYHPDHINVWSMQHFESILSKCGFIIVKEDHSLYDDTYLCQSSNVIKSINLPTKPQILEIMGKIKKAAELMELGKHRDAFEMFGNYPNAHVGAYESKRADWHKRGFDAIEKECLKVAIDACPKSAEINLWAGSICMRYNQWEKALSYLQTAIEYKPNTAEILLNVSHCFRHMAKETTSKRDQIKFMFEARQAARYLSKISMKTWGEAMTWVLHDESHLPMPGETEYPLFQEVEGHAKQESTIK